MAEDRVLLELSEAEAIVFFEWLTRFNKKGDDPGFEDQAEQRVLWDIEAMLETALVAPFEADYGVLLANARAKVRDAGE